MKYKTPHARIINITDSFSWATGAQVECNRFDEQKSRWQDGRFSKQIWTSIKIIHVVLLLFILYCLVPNFLQIMLLRSLNSKEEYTSHFSHNFSNIDLPWNHLLDIKNFTFIHQPSSPCNESNILYFIVVHSKPNNFKQRQIIRKSWGSLKQLGKKNSTEKWTSKLVFVLGQLKNKSLMYKKNLERLISDEVASHHDIVQASFVDLYHNLMYKHVLSLRWAYEKCSHAKFIVKSDDDAYVDLLGLYLYFDRTLGPLRENYMTKIIAGNVFPSNTMPQRTGKWAVSTDEYPADKYPSYLGGLAYLITSDVARDLSTAANMMNVKPLWVDDVFVTGLLANALQLRPIRLNARYTYDHDEVSKWAKNSKKNSSLPFNFAHLDVNKLDFETVMKRLWTKEVNFYNGTTLDVYV